MTASTPVPVSGRRLSRRRFVAASAAATGLVAIGGCALPSPAPEVDPLIPVAEAARRDAREFAAADASHGADVSRLRQLAEVRRVHADRLDGEIARSAGSDASIASGDDPPFEADTAPVCPPLGEVRSRLRTDGRVAADVAVAASGYRAELTAAIAAACVSAVEVVLA